MAGDSELAEAFKVLAWSQQNLVWARQRQANQLRSTLREYYPAALEGLANGGWNGDPRLAELGLCASAVKYDWLTPAMLSSASAPRQMRGEPKRSMRTSAFANAVSPFSTTPNAPGERSGSPRTSRCS